MHPYYGPGSQLLTQDNSSWIGLASMLMYLLFWAIVILIAFKLFRKYYIKPGGLKQKEDSAMSILRERYARGEIDADEFKQKKSDLGQ